MVVDLEAELRRWLDQTDKDDAVRVVCGGPGSGKSSSARHLAAALAREGRLRLVFIPLHRFELGTDLATAVGRFVTQSRLLPHNPLDPQQGEAMLLLVFDGLDELAMQGRTGQEAASDFVAQLQRTLRTANTQALHLKALVCGRELVIEQNRREFETAQVLHVLPYVVLPKWDEGELPGGGRQRSPTTSAMLGGRPTARPKASRSPACRPSFAATTSTRSRRSRCSTTCWRSAASGAGWTSRPPRTLTRSTRICSPRSGSVAGAKASSRTFASSSDRDFERVFEDVALAAWHGGDVRTSLGNSCRGGLQAERSREEARRLRARGGEGGGEPARRLLRPPSWLHAAGERSFEFTHKSFGEFLVARRLVRALRTLARALADREREPDEGWDERQALARWAELTGPAAMDHDLFAFVEREIAQTG